MQTNIKIYTDSYEKINNSKCMWASIFVNILDDFCDYYKALTLEKVRGLGDIYDVDACFKDPVHEIKGLKNIKRYFELLLTNISYCEFNIEQILERENQASLPGRWTSLTENLIMDKRSPYKVSANWNLTGL